MVMVMVMMGSGYMYAQASTCVFAISPPPPSPFPPTLFEVVHYYGLCLKIMEQGRREKKKDNIMYEAVI